MMFMDFPYYLVSLLYVYMVGYLRRCESCHLWELLGRPGIWGLNMDHWLLAPKSAGRPLIFW